MSIKVSYVYIDLLYFCRTSPGSLAEADVEAPPSRKRSRVWELIERKDSLRCFCTICKTVFKHKRGASTGTFKRHLETKHPAEWEEVIRPVEHAKQSAGATSVSTQLTQPGVAQAVESRKKLANDSQRKKELDRLVLQMICLDIQPFSVVSNKGFRKLVQALDARYDLPDQKTLRKKLLPEMYHEAKSELQGQLNKAKFLAISTDTWTSTDDMGFLTVTAHFIDESWQLLSKVLETTNLTLPHTAGNLSEALKAIFCNWGIQDKIACIVSDNCANIVKAVRELKYPHVACFAHTLQSVINDSIGHCQEVLQLRKRVQSVASYFHSSAIASDKLEQVQIQNHREPKKLKQDVLTLWNSTLSMLERYNEEHEMVVTALCMLGKPQKCLTSDELELSKNVVQCLKPFELATKELSVDKQTTASKVIPIVTALQYSLMRPELQSFTFAQILQQELHRRFDGWEQDGIHGQCTYLDPRFKKLGFDDESVVRSIEADLTKQIQGLMGNEEPPAKTTTQQQSETTNKTLWGLFDAKVKKYDAARKQPMSQPELRKYDEELLQDRKGDPCDWWLQNMQLLPNLSLIAHQYMCIPATSVPAERLFSKAGEVLSARRSCLKPETANMVLFLNKSSF